MIARWHLILLNKKIKKNVVEEWHEWMDEHGPCIQNYNVGPWTMYLEF